MTSEPQKLIRVVIADDHAPTREDVRFAIEQDERFRVVGEAADAARAIDVAVRLRPAVCLLDVNMPGSGLAAAWEINARLPQTKVVMLTVSEDDGALLAALRAGASGYLLKDIDPRSLPRALVAVLDGEAALPRALVTRLVNEIRDDAPKRRATVAADGDASRLTSREWQVLDLLREGQPTAEIARRLVLSPVTVRTHVNSILRKYGVSTRAELLAKLDAGEH